MIDTHVNKYRAEKPPLLSTYTDFRKYLSDFYKFKKRTESGGIRAYTYSNFSAAADIKSPNYLKLIIEGKRNLSDDMMKKFSKALKLNKADTEEFIALVKYGQATDPLQKNSFLKELSEIRSKRALQAGEIDQETWDQVPDWIAWVIYAMIDQKDVGFAPKDLKKLFRSHVTEDQIKASIDRLLQSNQISKEESGEFVQNRSMVEGQSNIPVELVRKLQAELIYLGLESLYRDNPKDREFGAFTLALNKEEFEEIRFELRKLRKKFQKDIMMNREKDKGERVYQFNVQLFPVTNENKDL